MAQLQEIIDELDRLLEPDTFPDHCPNGLQVAGRDEVARIVTGVSASRELFERALENGADLVLTHHGLFWDGDDVRVVGTHRERLRLLLAADISLASYHLPLDAHATFGNNALLARAIGATPTAPFALAGGRPVGWIASFDGDGIAVAELVQRVERLTARAALAFPGGPEQVRSVGVVSGGGGRSVHEAIAAGSDAFITGEAEEWSRALAREAGIHFIAAGHHATETFGVRALGEHLAERFDVRHEYIEIANPV
jgi:dinuclear metal center YbgI/SA1388 family protein